MRLFVNLMLILSLCLSALSAAGRQSVSFNDGWQFKKGPFSSDRIQTAGLLDGKWSEVKIPHTWNARDMQQLATGSTPGYYVGEAYYKKTFVPDDSLKGKRVFLRFEGVGSVAKVYVNGQLAGSHKGAYSAFVIELTEYLRFGKENQIAVLVDNTPRPDVVPINNTLFGVYGGIYRPVKMVVTDKIGIAVNDYAGPGIYISQNNVSAKSADITVKIKSDSKLERNKDVTLRTTIYDADGKAVAERSSQVTLAPQGRQFTEHKIQMRKPHLWQGLEDPYLYKVEVEMIADGKVVDKVAQPLGVRNIELKAADGVYLNGKKIPMYGVCRHQDWWQKGSALTDKEHDIDIEIMREIGATTLRLAHYQQAERMYAKADSIGFLVWAEIPFVNRVSTEEADNAVQQLTELIRQNYNHPSIYIWGLHNEVYSPSSYTKDLTARLNDLAKSEDPGRYTVSVSGYSDVDHQINNNADVQGINHYFGWYSKRIDSVESWVSKIEKKFPDHKVIFSEYGAEANIGQQEENPSNVGRFGQAFYPETFATKFHEFHWATIKNHPYLIASYVWNTFDFAIPASVQGGVENRNMKGLVTFDRKTKKDPFYWYKANWSKEPVVYLTERRAVQRENKVTNVTVYSNMGAPEIWVNGVKRTDYKQGFTDVHYIFENVELKEGDNVIETKVTKDGKTYEDRIEWNYDPIKAEQIKQKRSKPVFRNVEHVGL